MAGFFGLFSKKEEDSQPKESFFLDDESAKSMGDTEYMKAPKAVRRTFPAGGGAGHFETTVTVSALKSSVSDSRVDFTPKRVENQVSTSYTPAPNFSSASSFGSSTTPAYSAPKPPVAAQTESPSASNQAPQKRDQSNDGMDMFRNMAKKIGK